MNMKLIVILLLLFLNQSKALDDPRDFDVCILIKGGKAEVIKNTTGKDAINLIKKHGIELTEGYMILLDINENLTTVKRSDTSNGTIGYRVSILGDQELVYSIDLIEFLSYIKEDSEWVASPILIIQKKTGEVSRVIPTKK